MSRQPSVHEPSAQSSTLPSAVRAGDSASFDRRTLLSTGAAAGLAAGLAPFACKSLPAAEPLIKGMPNTEKLGWRVGLAAYSYRTVTLFEAIDKVAATGLRYIELFEWQKLSPNHPGVTSSPQLSAAQRKELKRKAADSDVKMIAVYARLRNLNEAKAMFEFAADMGIEAIVGEPAESSLDAIESLAAEYKVDLALHNHPKPSHYWNPEIGLAALKGRSERLGFCCDTGHWCRCGLDPVEMLKRVGPRVKTFHLKDLDRFGVREAQDVIWGQGVGRIADLLAEVKRQGIPHPYFSIEWERNPKEPLSTHAASVAFFEKVAGQLAAS